MATTHEEGEKVVFRNVTDRKAVINGREYAPGSEIIVTLKRDWEEDEGAGEGGAWGWGGYKGTFIKTLGSIERA